MAELKLPGRRLDSYEADFHAWSVEQAERLRRARPASVDWRNLAEEIDSLGRSDKRALGSDLKVVLEHLLKWHYQPGKRSDSWRDSIEEHRDRIARILADSPSLAGWPAAILDDEYARARRKALRDTGLASSEIPQSCPFALDRILDPDFLPE